MYPANVYAQPPACLERFFAMITLEYFYWKSWWGLTHKLGVKMADTGVVRVGSNVTEDVRVASGTEVATFGAVAVVSGVASCWEIFTGTVAGAEISTGAVVTGGSCAAW